MPEDLPLARSVVAGEVVTAEEWLMKRPDGRVITILCKAGPIRDGSFGECLDVGLCLDYPPGFEVLVDG